MLPTNYIDFFGTFKSEKFKRLNADPEPDNTPSAGQVTPSSAS
jgi:hypothetical protein